MTVTKQDEIELNGNKYHIKGLVKGAWIDPFPEQITLGDADYANRKDLSSWMIQDLRGGIGVEEMDEKVDLNKCWWTNCIIKYRNHILPPRLATSVTIPTPTVDGNPIFANFNGELYLGKGSTLSKLNAGRTAFEAVKSNFTTSISALIPYKNKLYVYLADADCIASDTLMYSNDTAYSSSSETPVKVAELTAKVDGTFRIKFDIKRGGTDYGYGRIYKNGIAVGTLQTGTTTSYVTKSQDIAGWEVGDLIQLYIYADAASTSYVQHFRIYGTDYTYWSMDTDESPTESEYANAQWGIEHDAKLFKVGADGTVEYSTDPDDASPTWSSGGEISNPDEIEGLLVGRDAGGVYTLYAPTHSVFQAYDSSTPQWVGTEAKLPNHPIGGRGHAYWNGKIYLSYGLAIKEYYPETGSFIDIGLTERDGLPVEYNGEIVKLLGDTGVKGMFASIDASITDSDSKSGLYLYDGFGWQCWWVQELQAEDFTAYTEVDTNGKLTVTATKATGADVDEDEDVYLYSDKGAAFFDELDIDFEIYIASTSLASAIGGMAISNTVGTIADFVTTDITACAWRDGANYKICLIRGNNVAIDTYTGAANTLYYCTLTRTAGSDSCVLKIYSDAARLTLLDTLTVAGFSTTTYRYIYGFVNYNTGSGGSDFDGYVQNLTYSLYNGDMHDIIVSSAASEYAVYWDCDDVVYYIDIPRGIENPDKITQNYAESGIFISPWYDAGNPVAAKLAKVLEDYAKGITTTEYVSLKYRLDHTYTDLDTGWTTLDTLNTTGETGHNEELFGSGAGISFKAIQFRLDFVTPGATAKPDIQSLVLYHKKRTGSEKLRVWNVTVLCDDYSTTSPKEKVANLKTAIESSLDVVFSYHPNDDSTESFYVTVDCPAFSQETGREYSSNYELQLTES